MLLTMSAKELRRMDTIQSVIDKRIHRRDATCQLAQTERQTIEFDGRVDIEDELRNFIEDLSESGDYSTPSKVIREPLRLLRDKQTGSRIQAQRDLLAEGLISSEPAEWGKGAFLKKVKVGTRAAGENR